MGTAVGVAGPVIINAMAHVAVTSRNPLPQTNALLRVVDDGHISDSMAAVLEEGCAQSDIMLPELEEALGGASRGYARWAARLASEYKLEFGIPKRTVANRQVVREALHKKLSKKNTRHSHMRSVLPLAVELVFLKDEADLELDRLMRQPEMVARARKSVKDYWNHTTWAGWVVQKVAPRPVRNVLERAFPGTFQSIPGFQA